MNNRQTALLIFLTVVLLSLVFVPASSAGDYSHARIVRLSFVSGDVQMTSSGDTGWQKAIVNTPIREGMSLATGDGHAEVEFENGATARIANNTVLQFLELALQDGAKHTRIGVTQGTATVYSSPGRHDVFVVEGGKLVVQVSENSRFRLDVFADGSSVSDLKGHLVVTANGASEPIHKGQTLAVKSDALAQLAVERNPAPDAWDHWVSQRDDAVYAGRNFSQQNIHSPVAYGLADLSYYGAWLDCGFGRCWQPSGVGYGWSPFFDGAWNYLPGFGLSWTSFEPWGWLPYHYGSWAFYPSYGWLWVPGNFNSWSPGSVYWVGSNNQIGWVPLAPKDKPGVAPLNLARGVITNTPSGLASGAPNVVAKFAAGSNLRFSIDQRTDPEILRAAQQLRTSTGASNVVTAGGSAPAKVTFRPAPVGQIAGGRPKVRSLPSVGFQRTAVSSGGSKFAPVSRGVGRGSSGVSRPSSSSSPAPRSSSSSSKPH